MLPGDVWIELKKDARLSVETLLFSRAPERLNMRKKKEINTCSLISYLMKLNCITYSTWYWNTVNIILS